MTRAVVPGGILTSHRVIEEMDGQDQQLQGSPRMATCDGTGGCVLPHRGQYAATPDARRRDATSRGCGLPALEHRRRIWSSDHSRLLEVSRRFGGVTSRG